MKLAIMQPYFFPYIGYFQLIHAVDKFILLDDVQYIRHGWVNRNRVLKHGGGLQYIIVPLKKHKRSTKIKNIETIASNDWKQTILNQLTHYKKTAPHYDAIINLIKSCFNSDEVSLSKLNYRVLNILCKAIDLNSNICISSECNFDYSRVRKPGDWAFEISKQLDALEYFNPIGGVDLFKETKFKKSGIKLFVFDPMNVRYSQKKEKFNSNLSIIDTLMYNGFSKTKRMIYNSRHAIN